MITYKVLASTPQDETAAFQSYAAWRVRQVSVQEATEAVGETFRWLQFCNQLQSGDKLWFFKSPPATWQALAGRGGFYIERGGKVADVFTSIAS